MFNYKHSEEALRSLKGAIKMKLENYINNGNTKVENLTEFINDNGEWQINYFDNPDFINEYADILHESEIYLGELDPDIKCLVEYLIENNLTDLIYWCVSVEHTKGIHCVSNELASFSIGEIEIQLSGLSDSNNETQCIFTELTKDLTESEIEEASNSSDYFLHDDRIYIDCSFERASLILEVDNFLDNVFDNFNYN